MKASVHPKELLELCNRLIKIPTKHPSFTFLDKILILVEGSTCSVRVTNMVISAELSTFATVEESGAILLDPALFTGILAGIPDSVSAVSLVAEGNELHVRSVGMDVTLPVFLSDDFPAVSVFDGTLIAAIPGSVFSDSVRKVAFAASTSDIKPELASVFVQFRDNQLVTVATDGFRLAEYSVGIDYKQEQTFLLSAKQVLDITKVIDIPGVVEITISDTMIRFQSPDMVAVMRLVVGNYPDYRQIIPRDTETTCTVLKDDVVRACKTVTGFTDQFTKIDVTVNPITSEFTIHAPRTEKGSGMVTISGAISGSDITIRMSAKNIIDALQTMSDTSVTFVFNGQSKPVVCTGYHSQDMVTLMMPMSR
jgi:DNA polymerase-3 subunit beta